jgi:short-subunit dehydrogenase
MGFYLGRMLDRMSMRVLIIGNSDGIGAALTKLLLSRGDVVVGISRSPGVVEHERVRHEVLDVGSPEYLERIRHLAMEGPGFDVCVYCAGVGSALELPDVSNEVRVVDVNFTGMVRTMSALLPRWLKERRGHFVGLSSLADAFFNPDAPSYNASKAGFSNYLYAMAFKLRPSGISVTNVRFGFVDTKMAKAPVKPLMISPETAARHIVRAIDRRPISVSVPKLTAAATWAVGTFQMLRTWIS